MIGGFTWIGRRLVRALAVVVLLSPFASRGETPGDGASRTNRSSSSDPHPNPAFSRAVAPLIGRRIVDVAEGRGDVANLAAR